MKQPSYQGEGVAAVDGYCTLPFELDLEMRTYHNKSFPLGIVKANLSEDKYHTWLCNKLVNCYATVRDKSFDSMETDLWSVKEGLMGFQGMELAPEAFSYGGMDIVEFNKSMIHSGHYVVGEYNEYYIPQKSCYRKYDYTHDYILFGYDDTAGVFYSAAYLPDGKYGKFVISYADYYQGIIGNRGKRPMMVYYKVKKDYNPKLRLDEIREKLEDYLYSRKGEGEAIDDEVDICGIDAWDFMAECVAGEVGEYDLRYSRLYMEHRGIMLGRIRWLLKQSVIQDERAEREYQKQVYMGAQGVHQLLIKYNITRKRELLGRIAERMREVNCCERQIIKEIGCYCGR